MTRSGILAVALVLVLAACQRIDPLARVRADCGNDALAPSAQAQACEALVDSGHLESAEHATALANTGAAHARGGDTGSALRDFAGALALDDANARALEGRARILVASGQFDAAEPLVNRLIATNAAGARAHLLQGQIAAGRSDFAAALDAFEAAVTEDSHNVLALVGRARMKEALSDDAGAMADFDAAITIDPHSAEARAGRCWLALNQGAGGGERDDTRPREDADEAVARAPQDFNAQTCRGVLQLRASEWADAKQSFDAALAIRPGDSLALFGRGVARRRGGDGAGLTDMNQARDFNHHIGERFDQLGVATY